jgi:hypothetical protein
MGYTGWVRDPATRFWEKVDKRGPDECWPWLGARNQNGYGKFRSPTDQLAHRFSYTLSRGPIAEGLCVCHHCDNPACCNPDHLFLGTPADNAQDKVSKNRQARLSRPGSLHSRARFTDDDILNIRRRYLNGETQKALAQEFSTSQSTISKIVLGTRWTLLPVEKTDSRYRRARGASHPQAKLTDDEIAHIRHRYSEGGISQASLAAEFGVSQAIVSDYVRGVIRA